MSDRRRFGPGAARCELRPTVESLLRALDDEVDPDGAPDANRVLRERLARGQLAWVHRRHVDRWFSSMGPKGREFVLREFAPIVGRTA